MCSKLNFQPNNISRIHALALWNVDKFWKNEGITTWMQQSWLLLQAPFTIRVNAFKYATTMTNALSLICLKNMLNGICYCFHKLRWMESLWVWIDAQHTYTDVWVLIDVQQKPLLFLCRYLAFILHVICSSFHICASETKCLKWGLWSYERFCQGCSGKFYRGLEWSL